ncbi:MAG: T9SS type A sorting domain-containing protein [Bacteroidetes bacterium]|nr:T9SS type A sorting domain-containing protein [Bacteroidota bacterium]
MKKFYLVLLITLSATIIHAQDVKLEWVKSVGGPHIEVGQEITTDATGNVYTTGIFKFTADFDPGTATFYLTSNGDWDIFIQKLDAKGNFVWAKSMGGMGWDGAYFIKIDDLGDVYVGGFFSGTVDFDPSGATFNLTSNGFTDGFMQKLDSDGNFVWAKSTSDTSQVVGKFTTDELGNVITIGSFSGTVDFDPGTATFNLTSDGDWDAFIQKLDADGNFIWAKSISGISDYSIWFVSTDGVGNVYLMGVYEGIVDFDPGATIFNLGSNDSVDIFIQKLDSEGNFVWANSMGGRNSGAGNSFSTDAFGNIFVTGTFWETVDFDPGPETFNLTSNGYGDIFIQHLDADGKFIWAKSIGGVGFDQGYSLITDISGNVYVSGSFQDVVDFDQTGASFNIISNGYYDVFIQKFDASGKFIWAQSMGGADSDNGYSIHIDDSDNLYLTGRFMGPADFDPGAGIFNLTDVGGGDVFIQKLSQLAEDTDVNTLLSRVSIYPNPIQEQVIVNLGNLKEVSIRVFSVSGQLIYNKENITASIHKFGFNEFPGLYIVELSAQGERRQYKLVKM